MNENIKKTGNILLTILLLLLGLYGAFIYFSPSLMQAIFKELGWSLIIAVKENSLDGLLQIIALVVLISVGAWYGYKYEKKGWSFWLRLLSISAILSFIVFPAFL